MRLFFMGIPQDRDFLTSLLQELKEAIYNESGRIFPNILVKVADNCTEDQHLDIIFKTQQKTLLHNICTSNK